MIETLSNLERRLHSAHELQQVVKTMKALAAVNIRPYEQAVAALKEYHRAVELGLLACFRGVDLDELENALQKTSASRAGVVVFGSDQGLVGQFNQSLAVFCIKKISELSKPVLIWPIGERIRDHLLDFGSSLNPACRVPGSIFGISSLIGEILLDLEIARKREPLDEIYVFRNRPLSGFTYEPVQSRLLPFDRKWLAELKEQKWPTRAIPEVLPLLQQSRGALIREYLFVELFQTCAESLASENASRLASMQGAEKNIRELLEQLQLRYNQQRQNSIDEELFDLVAGFESIFS